jgi:signal peptidase I
MEISRRIPWFVSVGLITREFSGFGFTVVAVALVVAFAITAIDIFEGLTGPIAGLAAALVPLCACIGILRGRAWGAWGLALYFLARLALMPLLLFRRGHSPQLPNVLSLVLSLLTAILFLYAGRLMALAGSRRGNARPWIVVTAIFTLPLFFVRDFVIPTGAMEDTILSGERILVRTFPSPAPARGDLIVFLSPADRRQMFVKRVIGVSGDRIRISAKNVYRNGVRLNEPYAVHKSLMRDFYRDDFPSQPYPPLYRPGREMLANHVVNGDVVVPAGMYIVRGDNRDLSLDSRYWGFIGKGDLIGKPFLIYDSDNRPEEALNRRVFRPLHTRWKRILEPL